MADINALYASLLAADEARDAAALTAVAWQMYGELATTAADLGALRARFRIYAAAPHASGRRPAPRRAPDDARAAAAYKGRPAHLGADDADEEADLAGDGAFCNRYTPYTTASTVRTPLKKAC